LTEIDGVPIADVMTRIDPIVPRDNDQTVRLLMPRFLLIPQVLRGLGIAGGDDVIVRTQDGSSSGLTSSITPIAMADYNGWAGGYGLHLPVDPDVPYLSRIGDVLWWQKLADGELYVQYNRVESTLLSGLQEQLDDPSVHGVVLDLRHNYGGEVSVEHQFEGLFMTWLAAAADHTLEVATGRNTFSAGSLIVAKLAQAGAVISGEAMGGCPTA
jgi:hypothetical protein